MAERMCIGCPFRSEAERQQLLRYIVKDPAEMWPCHESAEFNDLTPDDCQGRVIFGQLVARVARQQNQEPGGKQT